MGKEKKDKSEKYKLRSQIFIKWINMYLIQARMLVTDFDKDLCDGTKIVRLIEVISEENLPPTKKGSSKKEDHIDNYKIASKFLKSKNVKIDDDIKVKNIVNGKNEDTCKFIWELIKFYEIKQGDSNSEENEEGLLNWCQNITEKNKMIDIKDFKDSWNDGLAFCAVLEAIRPDLINFEILNKSDLVKNKNTAFSLAEKHLGMTVLLDENVEKQDKKAVILYVSVFRKLFNKLNMSEKGTNAIVSIMNKARQNFVSLEKFKAATVRYIETVNEAKKVLSLKVIPTTMASISSKLHEFTEFKKDTKTTLTEEKLKLELQYISIVKNFIICRMKLSAENSSDIIKNVADVWEELEDDERKFQEAMVNALEKLEGLEIKVTIFTKKANNRLLWLQETKNLISKIPIGSEAKETEGNYKKLESVEQEVNQNTDKINAVTTLYAEIESEGYPDMAALKFKRFQTIDLWNKLKDMLEKRKTEISVELEKHGNFFDIQLLIDWKNNVYEKININCKETSLKAYQKFLKKYEFYENDIKNLNNGVNEIFTTNKIKRFGRTYDLKIKEDDKKMILEAMDNISIIFSKNKQDLEAKIKLLTWFSNCDSHINYFKNLKSSFNKNNLVELEKNIYGYDFSDEYGLLDLQSITLHFKSNQEVIAELNENRNQWLSFDSEYVNINLGDDADKLRNKAKKKFEKLIVRLEKIQTSLQQLEKHLEIIKQLITYSKELKEYKNTSEQKLSTYDEAFLNESLRILHNLLGKVEEFEKIMPNITEQLNNYIKVYGESSTKQLNNLIQKMQNETQILLKTVKNRIVEYEKLEQIFAILLQYNKIENMIDAKERILNTVYKLDLNNDTLKILSNIRDQYKNLKLFKVDCEDISRIIKENDDLFVEYKEMESIQKVAETKTLSELVTTKYNKIIKNIQAKNLFYDEKTTIFKLISRYEDSILNLVEMKRELISINEKGSAQISDLNLNQRRIGFIRRKFTTLTENLQILKKDYTSTKESLDVTLIEPKVAKVKKIHNKVKKLLEDIDKTFLTIPPEQQFLLLIADLYQWISIVKEFCNKTKKIPPFTVNEVSKTKNIKNEYKEECGQRKKDLNQMLDICKKNQELMIQFNEVKDDLKKVKKKLKKLDLFLNLYEDFNNFTANKKNIFFILDQEDMYLNEKVDLQDYIEYKNEIEKWKHICEQIIIRNKLIDKLIELAKKLLECKIQKITVNVFVEDIIERAKANKKKIKEHYKLLCGEEKWKQFSNKHKSIMSLLQSFNAEKLSNDIKEIKKISNKDVDMFHQYDIYLCNLDECVIYVNKTIGFGFKLIHDNNTHQEQIAIMIKELKDEFEKRKQTIKNLMKTIFLEESDKDIFYYRCIKLFKRIIIVVKFYQNNVKTYYDVALAIDHLSSLQSELSKKIEAFSFLQNNKVDLVKYTMYNAQELSKGFQETGDTLQNHFYILMNLVRLFIKNENQKIEKKWCGKKLKNLENMQKLCNEYDTTEQAINVQNYIDECKFFLESIHKPYRTMLSDNQVFLNEEINMILRRLFGDMDKEAPKKIQENKSSFNFGMYPIYGNKEYKLKLIKRYSVGDLTKIVACEQNYQVIHEKLSSSIKESNEELNKQKDELNGGKWNKYYNCSKAYLLNEQSIKKMIHTKRHISMIIKLLENEKALLNVVTEAPHTLKDFYYHIKSFDYLLDEGYEYLKTDLLQISTEIRSLDDSNTYSQNELISQHDHLTQKKNDLMRKLNAFFILFFTSDSITAYNQEIKLAGNKLLEELEKYFYGSTLNENKKKQEEFIFRITPTKSLCNNGKKALQNIYKIIKSYPFPETFKDSIESTLKVSVEHKTLSKIAINNYQLVSDALRWINHYNECLAISKIFFSTLEKYKAKIQKYKNDYRKIEKFLLEYQTYKNIQEILSFICKNYLDKLNFAKTCIERAQETEKFMILMYQLGGIEYEKNKDIQNCENLLKECYKLLNPSDVEFNKSIMLTKISKLAIAHVMSMRGKPVPKNFCETKILEIYMKFRRESIYSNEKSYVKIFEDNKYDELIQYFIAFGYSENDLSNEILETEKHVFKFLAKYSEYQRVVSAVLGKIELMQIDKRVSAVKKSSISDDPNGLIFACIKKFLNENTDLCEWLKYEYLAKENKLEEFKLIMDKYELNMFNKKEEFDKRKEMPVFYKSDLKSKLFSDEGLVVNDNESGSDSKGKKIKGVKSLIEMTKYTITISSKEKGDEDELQATQTIELLGISYSIEYYKGNKNAFTFKINENSVYAIFFKDKKKNELFKEKLKDTIGTLVDKKVVKKKSIK